MNTEQVKGLALLAALLGGGYLAWRAYSTGASVVSGITGALGTAYDAVSGVVSDAVGAVAGVPEQIVTAVHGPAVPIGGQSVQQRHATDLPEGSSQAAAMYWSLYPDAVFYD